MNTSGLKLAKIRLKNVSQLQRYWPIFYLRYFMRSPLPPVSRLVNCNIWSEREREKSSNVVSLFPVIQLFLLLLLLKNYSFKRRFSVLEAIRQRKSWCRSHTENAGVDQIWGNFSLSKIFYFQRFHSSLSAAPQKEDLFIFHRLVGWVAVLVVTLTESSISSVSSVSN